MAITLDLTSNAVDVLRARYLLKDENGAAIESPEQMFRRVAHHVAAAEARYDGDVAGTESRFFDAMTHLQFLPNSPTLMNAGAALGQLAACFVLPVEDSLDSIFGAIRDSALIHQTGGGVGYDFSRIRPRGDTVASTGGDASGPISFMKVFDAGVEAIRQGGRRRGANMGILDVRHPDIEDFIRVKRDRDALSNFNLSVATPDSFLEATRQNEPWELVNPRTGEVTRRISASALLDLIAECAWETGDPGMIFLDRINRDNPTPSMGTITSTNPCGEVPLLPYEACMLGSINLSRFIHDDDVDWPNLGRCVHTAIRFLDDCLDISRWPLAQIAEAVASNRKVGLGVMGLADALIDLGIAYDSEDAETFAERVMQFVSENATDASRRLAVERGAFPNFEESRLARAGGPPIRNATRTAIAPTGTISIIAGCSSGIEPLYAIAFQRHVLDGRTLLEINPRFERLARSSGAWTEPVRHAALHHGSLECVEGVPESLRRLFRTAHEIPAEWHIRIQAAFQRHVDNAVSKTVNLRREADVDDVRQAYQLSFDLGCKGITIYREGSKEGQVLTQMSSDGETCPECGATLHFAESTAHCRVCGYSPTE